jgi:geranylgeranyl diphosphate synthase, type II
MFKKQISDLLENYLKNIQFKKYPNGLYEGIEYILNLGGKRIRPQLVLLSCKLFGGDAKAALPAAAAVELFHNFSLIHDDIMDNASVRRNKPTVHKKFNENSAILSGDACLVMCYDELLKLSAGKQFKAIQLFNKMALEVCEGQQYDMLFETKNDVSVNDYVEMIRLKTAVLLGFALQLGAMIADADEKNQTLLKQLGEELGIAFQLQDDMLDTFGDEKSFGKKIGGDILQNKKTFLLLKAKDLANAKQMSVLNQLIQSSTNNDDEKIERITSIFNELNLKNLIELSIKNHYDNAIAIIKKLSITEEAKNELFDFINQLMKREK